MSAEVLEKAADWLDEHEWCQGRMIEQRRTGEARCAVGAIRLFDPPTVIGIQSETERELGEYLNVGLFGTVEMWNDRAGGKPEVVATMRAAAKALRTSPPTSAPAR